MTRAIARGQITFSKQLLIQEKEEIRSAWYAINGSNLPDTVGETGSYYITRQLAAKYGVRAGSTIRTFNGTVRVFNGIIRTYPGIGTAHLDTAYIALREFLRSSGLFLTDDSFHDVFDWDEYSRLLAVYANAESAILEAVESTQDEGIDKAATDIERLQEWGEDGVISPIEKKSLQAMYEKEALDYTRLIADATRYLALLPSTSTEYSDLDDAKDDAEEAWADSTTSRGAYYAFEAILASLDTSSDRTTSHYDDIIDYFSAKETLIAAISAATDYITETKAKKSDIEYLIDALADGNDQSVLSGGLILAHIIGVKDASNNVLAFMNGMPGANNEFVDSTHGVIMLAAGIPTTGSVSAAKTDAKFRVFSDGYMFSTSGKIGGFTIGATRLHSGQTTSYVGIDSGTANVDYAFWCGNATPDSAPFSVTRAGAIKSTSGKIGGFDIFGSYLQATESETDDVRTMFMSSSLVGFSEEDTTSGTANYYAKLGSNVLSAVLGYNTTMAVGASASGGSYSLSGKAVGIYASVSGFKESIAFYCPNGEFHGLRPKTRYTNTSIDLNQYDYNVVVNNSSDVSVYLPSPARRGQDYTIIHLTGNKLTIVVSESAHPMLRVDTGDFYTITTGFESYTNESYHLTYVADFTKTYNGTTYYGIWILQPYHN